MAVGAAKGAAGEEKSDMKEGRAPKAMAFALILISLFLLICPLRAAEKLGILHFNDFHGRIFPYLDPSIRAEGPAGGVAYLAEMIKKERSGNKGGTMLLAAGDLFQGTPVSNLFLGKPVIETMNRLHLDAMVLGNHEFDWGRPVLQRLGKRAKFPFLAANVVDRKGDRLPGVKPYIMFTRKGVEVAVIGVTTPETAFIVKKEHVADLTFLDPVHVVPALVEEVRKKGARLVILLTHLGLDADRALAGRVPGIDVIVGGHSHTVVTDPVKVGNTVIVQAGYNGLYLGILELLVDEKTGKVLQATTRDALKLVSATGTDACDTGIAAIAEGYGRKVKGRFEKVVGETRIDLVRDRTGESVVGNHVTDAMREASGAEVAIHNSGGIRTDIPAGKITVEQVFALLPFDNQIVVMDLTGRDLVELFENALGENKGMLQVSGMNIRCSPGARPGARVAALSIAGVPVDLSKRYRVATNDFLAAGGDNVTGFQKGTNVAHGGDLREAFEAYLKKHSPLAGKTEERIVIDIP
jgi:5'-nucleotidase / UDP-sugar diphosphatase